jgi:hypothetical protein
MVDQRAYIEKFDSSPKIADNPIDFKMVSLKVDVCQTMRKGGYFKRRKG